MGKAGRAGSGWEWRCAVRQARLGDERRCMARIGRHGADSNDEAWRGEAGAADEVDSMTPCE